MYKFKFKVYRLLSNNEYRFDHDVIIRASDKCEARVLASNMFAEPDYKLESWGIVTNDVCN